MNFVFYSYLRIISMDKQREIILASGSPRRRQLLEQLRLPFTVADKYGIDESYPPEMVAEEVAPYLSKLKSEAYTKPIGDNQVLLTADTVVIIDGVILGKPADEAEAIAMLMQLNGRTHVVITGVTLRTAEKSKTFAVTTEVTFAQLTAEQIANYVAQYRPLDKAGAYGAQEWMGLAAVRHLNGSYHNVVGLPTSHLIEELNTL